MSTNSTPVSNAKGSQAKVPISVEKPRKSMTIAESNPPIGSPFSSQGELTVQELRINSTGTKSHTSSKKDGRVSNQETASLAVSDIVSLRDSSPMKKTARHSMLSNSIPELTPDTKSPIPKKSRKSILKLRGRQPNSATTPGEDEIRRDNNGVPIIKGSKKHKIVIADKPIIFEVDSWKRYNSNIEVEANSCSCILF
eukprot:TRINITY_DN7777_c0_g4_i1.p1 TRINITY_DN7777_c0_g4~~TRINITY_DN7777_c0_g4_i1.p1  ORF type:complete len:197 (-),score=17.20 TRINITY_DN7777_c0_g4_i1:35-625(-)